MFALANRPGKVVFAEIIPASLSCCFPSAPLSRPVRAEMLAGARRRLGLAWKNMAFLSDVSVPRMHCLRRENATGPESEWRSCTRRCLSDNVAGRVHGRGGSVLGSTDVGQHVEEEEIQIHSNCLLFARRAASLSLTPSLPSSSLSPFLPPSRLSYVSRN